MTRPADPKAEDMDIPATTRIDPPSGPTGQEADGAGGSGPGRPWWRRPAAGVAALLVVALTVAVALVVTGSEPSEPSEPSQTSQPSAPGARGPAGSTVLFEDSFTDGDWCDYHRVQNRYFSGRACKYDNDSYALRPDGSSARFEVRGGDDIGGGLGGGERSELSHDSASWQAREGEEWFVHERLRLNRGFESGRWTILTQFHSGDGSPPLSLQVSRDGALILRSGGEAGEANEEEGKGDRVLVPADEFREMRGDWFEVILHVRWSEDIDDGGTEAYVNGELVAPWRRQQTMTSDRIYWKGGIYRAPVESTAVLWMDDLVISRPGTE
jgi:Polysaccharide lyase